MSFYNKSSLLTIPTAYKQGKLYSVKPDDGTGDFTFTRSTSATRVNSDGLIESVGVDVPRIDYSSGTPALLLEPQRTNLVLQSEDFGNYININSTDVSNVTISPEGFTNATSFLEAATTGQHKLFTSFNFDGTNTYTFSIFAKHNGRDLFIDTQNSNEWSGRAWFDLTNGTANAILGTAAIEDFGNGWYRCIVTGISNIAGANFVELLTSDGSTNIITGDITKGVYIYGCQLEQGSYATSYIPTNGASVTRTNEDCFLTNAQNVIGQTEGTLYCEFLKSDDDAYTIIEINLNDSTSDRLLVYATASNTRIAITLSTNGVQQFNVNIIYSINNINKIALTYTNNNFKLFVNGSLEWTSVTGTLSSSYNYVAFKDNNLSSSQSKTVNIITFPTVLTDAECITLTTI